MCLQIFIHAFRHFPWVHDRGGRADDLDFSIDLARSTAIFQKPEILYIIRINCYTTQGDPDSSFPYGLHKEYLNSSTSDFGRNFKQIITNAI